MNEIGLSSRLPSTGATPANTPRVGSESERTAAASSVTTPPGSASTSTPSAPTVGASGETVSISPDAYRLQQATLSTTEAADSTADSGMNSEQATALLQTIRDSITQNPQSFFQAQTGQFNAQRAAGLLAA